MTKRQKQIFNRSTVAHYWANQVQDSAKDSGNRMSFNGYKMYSYSTIVAYIHELHNLVLVTSNTYSNTTTKHMGYIDSSISHYKKIIRVPYIFGAKDLPEHEKNIQYFIDNIEFNIEKQKKAKKVNYLPEIERNLLLLIEYVQTFEVTIKEVPEYIKDWIDLYKHSGVEGFYSQFDILSEQKLVILNKQREEQEEARKKYLKEQKQKALKLVKAWKAKDLLTYNIKGKKYSLSYLESIINYLPNIYLRTYISSISGNIIIETSKGVNFTEKDGVKLYKLMKRCKDKKETYTSENLRINNYKIDFIKSDGTLIAGCHKVLFKEAEYIKKKLKWKI